MASAPTQPPNHPTTQPPPRWFWPALVVAHALALGYQLWAGHWFFPDSDRYLEAARNLGRHGTLYAWPWPPARPLSPQEFSIRPPGYPVFLLLLGLKVPLVLLAQNALSLLNLWLVVGWLRRHAALSPRRWLLLALLILTAPAQLIYANALMSETLLQTLVVGLWLTLTRFFQTGATRPLLLAALLAAAALLVKPVFYPFAGLLPLLVGGWLLVRRAWRVLFWQLSIAALPLLVTLAWQARNEARTGYFHFSSIAEINLLRYNTRAVLRATAGPEAAERFVAGTVARSERLPAFADQQRYIVREATAVLRQHPVAYALLHLRGMINAGLDPGRFDLLQFFGLQHEEATGLLRRFDAGGYRGLLAALAAQPWGLLLALLLVFGANAVRGGLFVLWLFNARFPLVARLVAAGLVLYVVGLTGPLGAARFLVPVLPLVWLGAGASQPWRTRVKNSVAVPEGT